MPIISGILRHLDGSAWVGADLLFQLLQPSYTASTQFPVDTKAATTIAGGAFSVTLWDNGGGLDPSYIRCTINGVDRLEFIIPTGSGNVPLVSLLNPVGSGTQGTRTITGHFEYLDQTPRAGEKVRVSMGMFSYTADAIYSSDSLDLTLDSNGDFSQAIWANGGGSISAPIKFKYPTGEVISVTIPAGSGSISLSSLRALNPTPPIPSAPPSIALALIAAHNADPAAHPGGIAGSASGGGGGGGGTADLEKAWTIVSTNTSMLATKKYRCTGLSLQLLSLPSTASSTIGDVIAVMLDDDGAGFRVTQAAGHVVSVGSTKSTIGITGSIGSVVPGDYVEIEYLGSGKWIARSIQGNLELT